MFLGGIVTGAGAGSPRVTVLMPVYNGEAYLREAIESILVQTYRDFEFLIINDGSTDRSAEVIEAYRDSRIQSVNNETNLGLIATLNKGLDLAEGEFVCRMDQDDISLPERLSRQVAFMQDRPEIVVCGSWFQKFGVGRDKVVRWQTDPEGIRCGLLFDSMVGHPTVMMRREFLRENNLYYDPAYKNAEDFALWLRISEIGHIANLGEVLLQYRVHPAQITQSASAGQRETAGKARLIQLNKMGIEPSTEEFEIHQAISTCQFSGIDNLFSRAEEWLCKLKSVNERVKRYPEPAFSQVLFERWLTFCKKATEQRYWSTNVLYFPKLMDKTGMGYRYVLRYILTQLRN
jgi:glycosyltransferase involved in cell wall biosynthesis